MSSFSLGAQEGGQVGKQAVEQMQELRNLFNKWTGEYSADIREFAFLLRVDAEFYRYTAMWNILGAQKAKRKRDWVEVEIGIPETWWRLAHTNEFRKRLAEEVEKGFISMIDVLRKNRRDIKGESLLKDWLNRSSWKLESKCSSWRNIAISGQSVPVFIRFAASVDPPRSRLAVRLSPEEISPEREYSFLLPGCMA